MSGVHTPGIKRARRHPYKPCHLRHHGEPKHNAAGATRLRKSARVLLLFMSEAVSFVCRGLERWPPLFRTVAVQWGNRSLRLSSFLAFGSDTLPLLSLCCQGVTLEFPHSTPMPCCTLSCADNDSFLSLDLRQGKVPPFLDKENYLLNSVLVFIEVICPSIAYIEFYSVLFV